MNAIKKILNHLYLGFSITGEFCKTSVVFNASFLLPGRIQEVKKGGWKINAGYM